MQFLIHVHILKKNGFEITYLDVDSEGFVSLEDVGMQSLTKQFL